MTTKNPSTITASPYTTILVAFLLLGGMLGLSGVAGAASPHTTGTIAVADIVLEQHKDTMAQGTATVGHAWSGVDVQINLAEIDGEAAGERDVSLFVCPEDPASPVPDTQDCQLQIRWGLSGLEAGEQTSLQALWETRGSVGTFDVCVLVEDPSGEDPDHLACEEHTLLAGSSLTGAYMG